ncbi:DUF6440 family protein [Clostridium sp. AWRP]|uniref:DUF6440 family protein n=1 Tax=Clostridium sp. AWRP TaxID=2212991 RepID=UPI000FD81188|nr:DUF6440 family protein [Clostridium sp. AWRP]AZV58348.1 hypothetical protein DMR38_18120 [Clostridium sp. AWRP]
MFGEKSNKRFEEIFKEGTTFGYKVIVDKETGVEYLFSYDGYAGGLTLLVDKDGKPIIKSDNE